MTRDNNLKSETVNILVISIDESKWLFVDFDSYEILGSLGYSPQDNHKSTEESLAEFLGIQATKELMADPRIKEEILLGKEESIENCVSMDDLDW